MREENRTLISRRQKTGPKTIQSARRDQPSVEHHEPGKVPILGTEAVPEPGPHARTALKAIPRM